MCPNCQSFDPVGVWFEVWVHYCANSGSVRLLDASPVASGTARQIDDLQLESFHAILPFARHRALEFTCWAWKMAKLLSRFHRTRLTSSLQARWSERVAVCCLLASTSQVTSSGTRVKIDEVLGAYG